MFMATHMRFDITVKSFTQTGGARLDWLNVTMPFATLSGTPDALTLSCWGRDYVFPKSTIARLSRHRGILSVGLHIEHHDKSLPKVVIFWASALFFWTSGFLILKTRLESLGYEVRA